MIATIEAQKRTMEQLEVETALAQAQFGDGIQSLEATMEQLFRHLENMAGHVVALEGVVKELATKADLDHDKILEAVRVRIAGPEGNLGDSTPAEKAARQLMAGDRLN